MAKGPVGIIVATSYVLLGIAIFRRWDLLKPLVISPGILFFIIITVPWFWGMADVYEEPFVEQVFSYFFLNRIVDPVMDQGGALWYYIPVLLAGFLPWTTFFPLMGYVFYKNKNDKKLVYLSAWILLTFIIFTISATKRPNYLVFIYPALSMMLGWVIHKVLVDKEYIKTAGHIFYCCFNIGSGSDCGSQVFIESITIRNISCAMVIDLIHCL
jgi:4-amino-4-deoxy-L-arabinose transferase-like glycosyltransferase